jgi:L-lactate dehydrogenase complex protein LldG
MWDENYYGFFQEAKNSCPLLSGQKTGIYQKHPWNHSGNGMPNRISMNSKEKILSKIRENRPNPWPLPDIPVFQSAAQDKCQLFIKILERGGSKGITVSDVSEVIQVINSHFPESSRTITTLPYLEGMEQITSLQPGFYEGTSLAIIGSALGVAENGALWVTENEVKTVRVLPFITQHLVLVVSQQSIVGTMHEAYAQLGAPTEGFGVFIAGPSKTADIEQSLVIGAQGARSLLVIITP